MYSQKFDKTSPKKVILWAAPRCVSTAFTQTFLQRPDTITLFEPFLEVYYFSKWRRSNRLGDCEKWQYYGIDSVMAKIKSQTAPLVFIKDMAYQAWPYIDEAFLNLMVNTFIIRHPHEAIASWYRINEFPTEEEFGFTVMRQLWKKVTKEVKQEPIVIEGNRFRYHPESVIINYCQRIGVKFHPEMLSWKDERLVRDNRKSHQWEMHAQWHKTLNNSTGILPPTKGVEADIRPQDIKMVEHALKIYEEFLPVVL